MLKLHLIKFNLRESDYIFVFNVSIKILKYITTVCGASPRTDAGTDPAGLFTTPAERCSEKLVDLGKDFSLIHAQFKVLLNFKV